MSEKKEVECPVCGSISERHYSNLRDIFVNDGAGKDFEIYFCPRCEIGFTHPFLEGKDFSYYYPEQFEAYSERKTFTAFLLKRKYNSDVRMLLRNCTFSDRPSLYEIGAGRGEFLSFAASKGFSVDGSEPSENGRRIAAERYSVELDASSGEDLAFKRKYNAVVLRHVLEHISKPDVIVKKILENALDQDGILFIKVPNYSSWERRFFQRFWHGLDTPRHLFHYTGNGLVRLLKESGFSRVAIYEEKVPTDFVRSLFYTEKYGKIGFAGKIFNRLPGVVKTILAQFIVIVLSPFSSGRLIAIARK